MNINHVDNQAFTKKYHLEFKTEKQRFDCNLQLDREAEERRDTLGDVKIIVGDNKDLYLFTGRDSEDFAWMKASLFKTGLVKPDKMKTFAKSFEKGDVQNIDLRA